MSHHHRPSSVYQPTASTTSSSSSHTTALQSRVNAKRAELEQLHQLRDLSAALASQMGVLESKIEMLTNGTEAFAEIMKNWSGVLGVLGMAGESLRVVAEGKQAGLNEERGKEESNEVGLPDTLVRIPLELEERRKEKENEAG